MFIILQNQEQFGPFDLDQLQAIVNEGHFQLTDYCWAEEWIEWKLLSTVVSRIPQALQNVIPGGANENFVEVTSEPVNRACPESRMSFFENCLNSKKSWV